MFKKQLLTITLVLFTTVLSAQEFKPFKVGLGLGYAAPSEGGGGVAIYLEPAYRVSDEIAVGLRLESAALIKTVGENEGSISGNGSYTVNGQYYFSNNKFRPFVGLGLGLYTLASVSVDFGSNGNGSAGVAAETAFGFYPRVGFDLGHFNFLFDFNIIGNSEAIGFDDDLNETTFDVKNSYWALKLGFSIGGGNN